MEQFKNALSCDEVMSPVVRLFDDFSIKFNFRSETHYCVIVKFDQIWFN